MKNRPQPIEINIRECKTKEEIDSTYPVMRQLRPHISEPDYFSRVAFLMGEEQFRLFGAYDSKNRCLGVIGFQKQNRLSLGNIIYIADLVTDEQCRSQGIGTQLLNLVKNEAIKQKIDAIVLDSGIQRKQAHLFYQRHGYKPESYSFRLVKPFDDPSKELNTASRQDLNKEKRGQSNEFVYSRL